MVKEGGFRRRKRERNGERERKGENGLTEGKIENEIELGVIVDIIFNLIYESASIRTIYLWFFNAKLDYIKWVDTSKNFVFKNDYHANVVITPDLASVLMGETHILFWNRNLS